jgi:hypothetical protein
MFQKLDNQDIKLLRQDVLTGFLLSVITFVVFLIIFVFTLQNYIKADPASVLAIGIVFSVFVFWIISGAAIKDLKSGKKEIVKKALEIHEDERKVNKSKVSSLFSAWSIRKKKKKNNFLLHIDTATFEVSEEVMRNAEKKGFIVLHYSLYGRKVLKIEYF